jgi:AcrR family transcriptional regulator
LFYRHGIARVALETIADRAGVTKRTLYYHFRSKDDLLAAALQFRSEFAVARVRRWGISPALDLDGAVDALFDSLGRWAGAPRYEGGGYTRIAMELADLPGHPARSIARQQKSFVEAWLADEFGKRGAADPLQCARQVQILLEGAMALMLIHGDVSYAAAAAQAAKRLIRRGEGAAFAVSRASPRS